MRNVARLKMGYYPLPEAEGVKLRSLLSFAGLASVIDPCVGQGTALHLVTKEAPARRHWWGRGNFGVGRRENFSHLLDGQAGGGVWYAGSVVEELAMQGFHFQAAHKSTSPWRI